MSTNPKSGAPAPDTPITASRNTATATASANNRSNGSSGTKTLESNKSGNISAGVASSVQKVNRSVNNLSSVSGNVASNSANNSAPLRPVIGTPMNPPPPIRRESQRRFVLPPSPPASVAPPVPSTIEKLVNTNTTKKNPALINLPALIALSKWNPKDAAKAARTILTAVGDTLPVEVRSQYEQLSQPIVENTSVAAPPIDATSAARALIGLPALTSANTAVSDSNELATMRRYKELGIRTNFFPDATRHAIAELIAYEPDEYGFATLKFLVEVDTDEPMEGGGRETYQQYITRLQNKDYVEKTYDLAMNALGYHGFKRRQFELTRVGDQCRGVGIDDRRPCWLCGNPVNLFKDIRGPKSVTSNGGEFRMCEPDNNAFQCEHLLPAGLMAFLDYLYIDEVRPSDPSHRAIMIQLYDSSCRTCNRIKTNNIYIRSNNDGISAIFEPNIYEIQKDVIAFFLDICGSQKKICPGNNQQAAIKKEGESFYYHSIVTVTKAGRTTHYPNLILAILNEEARNTGSEPSSKKRRRGDNNSYDQPSYGSLGDIFRDIDNTFTIARIYESASEFNTIPESIEQRIPLRKGVDWIENCSRRIIERVQGICNLLNNIERKTEWVIKYTNALLNPPRFVEDIVSKTKQKRSKTRRTGRSVAARAVADERQLAMIRREDSISKRAQRAANRGAPPPLPSLVNLFKNEVDGQDNVNNSIVMQNPASRIRSRKARKASKKTRRRK
jgi:hypothetical protein